LSRRPHGDYEKIDDEGDFEDWIDLLHRFMHQGATMLLLTPHHFHIFQPSLNQQSLVRPMTLWTTL
jgi:hypothetical protein